MGDDCEDELFNMFLLSISQHFLRFRRFGWAQIDGPEREPERKRSFSYDPPGLFCICNRK